MTADVEPFVVDKNLGVKMQVGPGDLPRTNADGDPVVQLTPEQKYLFDVKGWLMIPGVLGESEAREMHDYALRVHNEPESLPEQERSYVSGPLQRLTDHPVVVGFLSEFLAHPHLSTPECYCFRLEACNLAVRSASGSPGRFGPHNGNGFFRYRAFSGFVRRGSAGDRRG